MEALLLVGSSFLIWATYCWIAWVRGYSPEESARKRIEFCEKHLSELEEHLKNAQAEAETTQERMEVESLNNQIKFWTDFKADEEKSLIISFQ